MIYNVSGYFLHFSFVKLSELLLLLLYCTSLSTLNKCNRCNQLPGKAHLRNELLCVKETKYKFYILTHSVNLSQDAYQILQSSVDTIHMSP